MPNFKATVKEYLRPITSRISPFTTPIANKWRAFANGFPKLSRVIKWGSIAAFMGFLALVTFIAMVYYGAFTPIPTYGDLKNIKNYNASEIYSEDGALLGKYFRENRLSANLNEISPKLINALVATEDARFFEHRGVDFRAMMRVLFKSILMGDDSAGGGSTLSQQLAKNLYGRERFRFGSMPINKLKEMIVARRLEKIYSKPDLLRMYLNTVSFGDDIFGVKVASKRFFNATPANIKQEDAAVLIGMLKATRTYNPIRNPERSLQRRNTVLSQMVKANYLEQTTYDSLKFLPIQSNYYLEGTNKGLATYFREHLRGKLPELLKDIKKPDGSAYNIYTDGLKIYTTIHSRVQKYAEEAVREHMSVLQKDFNEHWKGGKAYGTDALLDKAMKNSDRYKALKARGLSAKAIKTAFAVKREMTIFDWNEDGEKVIKMSPIDSIKYYLATLNAGFLAMQAQTGKVQAWVGGTDYKYFKYDHVKSRRQVGSTFKPIVYAEALRQGQQPCDYIDNLLVTYTEWEDWRPENSDGKYEGVYSMQGGLTNSVNSVTVDVIMRTGVDSVAQMAKRLGIDSDIPPSPSIALGAADIALWDMAQVYGTFANNGQRPEPYYITKIEDRNGNIIANYEAPNPEEFEQVIAQDHARLLTTFLESVVDSGTAKRLRYRYDLPNQIAGKTGTTQNQSNGWFMGYTPNLVVGAWVGAESPTVHWRSLKLGQGANTALPIYGIFQQKMNADKQFRLDVNRSFPTLNEELLAQLDCAPYLDSRADIPLPPEVQDSIDNQVPWIIDVFTNQKNKNKEEVESQPKRNTPQSRPSNRPKSPAELRNERIKKQRERKAKRKQFFDKLKKRGN